MARFQELSESLKEKARQIGTAIKAQKERGDPGGPDETVRRLLTEYRELERVGDDEARRIQLKYGIPDEYIDALEDAVRPAKETPRLQRREIAAVEPSWDINDVLPPAVAELRKLVPADWLASQAKKEFRLGESYRERPFCLANGRRLTVAGENVSAQRLARMILISEDHLRKRDDVDFWDASLLIPETIAVGSQLTEMSQLGLAAESKLARLWGMPDEHVASTLFELLVGAACLKAGLGPEMLSDAGNATGQKTPEFRLRSIEIPTVVECKRRFGLSEYERSEALWMLDLFERLRLSTRANVCILMELSIPYETLDLRVVRSDILRVIEQGDEGSKTFAWGSVTLEALKYRVDFARTRLYSPDFLAAAFNWSPERAAIWDGIVCQVDPPGRIALEATRMPLALLWKQTCDPLPRAKIRGISSLLSKAIKQIPFGETGMVYLAYEEGLRSELADLRTAAISDELKHWATEWGRLVLGTIVDRIYPYPVLEGRPDLIENAVIYGAENTHPDFMAMFPARMFVPER